MVSGIELAKEFLKTDNELRIIVITGYSEFDYVRDAVALGAIDLLLKPIGPEDINASLKKAADHFAHLRRRHHTERVLRHLLTENQSLLQERCISQLFTRPPEGGEIQIREQFKLLSLSFPERYFVAVLIHLDPEYPSELGVAAFSTAFKKLCDAALKANGFRFFTCFGASERLDCLINWSFDHGDELLENLFSKLLDETQFYFQTSFSAGIGGTVNKPGDLYRSAEQAQLALHFSDSESPSVTNYRNVKQLVVLRAANDESNLDQLIKYARNFDMANFRNHLKVCFNADLSIESIRELALEILSRLSNICYNASIYPWSIVNYPNTVASIFSTSTVADIRKLILATAEKLINSLLQQRSQSKNQLISLAKAYIQKHFSDAELSLDSVSSHVGLSKIYFCQLFHKEEGTSFNNYLNMVRITLSKKLLRESNKKIFEISDDVGYRNAKYFSYKFKHIVGVTPMEYRNNKNN